jgi:hypothetical protein
LNILLGTDVTSTDEHDLADVDTYVAKVQDRMSQLPRLREFDRRRTARRGVLYWLKHETPQWGDEWEINEHGAGVMIGRAITRFHWAYKQSTVRMEQFLREWRERGFGRPAV